MQKSLFSFVCMRYLLCLGLLLGYTTITFAQLSNKVYKANQAELAAACSNKKNSIIDQAEALIQSDASKFELWDCYFKALYDAGQMEKFLVQWQLFLQQSKAVKKYKNQLNPLYNKAKDCTEQINLIQELRNSGDKQQTMQMLNNLLVDYPQMHAFRILRAANYFDNQELELAKQDFDYVLDHDPEMAFAIYIKARYLYTKSDFVKASKLFEDVVWKDAGFNDAYYFLAICKLNLNDEKSAIYYSNKLLRIDPRNAKAYIALGKAYYQLSDYQTSIKNFKAAINLGFSDVIVYKYLADNYIALNYRDESIDALNEYIKKDTTNDEIYYKRGILYSHLWRDRKSHDLAVKDFTKAISINPNVSFYYTYRGKSEIVIRNDLSLAEADFNKAKELNPYNYINYERLHWLAFYHNDTKKASELRKECLSAFKELIDSLPQNAEAYFNAGQCLDLLDDTYSSESYQKSVIEYYEQAVELDNSDNTYWFKIGVKYNHLKEYDKVISAMQKAIAIKDVPLYHIYISGAYQDLGNNDEALKVLNQAIQLHPDDWQLYQSRSILHRKLKMYKEAEHDKKMQNSILTR